MNCATFEHDVAELMGDGVAEAAREAHLERLQAHAIGCDACSGTRDLLDLLSRPAGRRDLVDDPGPDYWSEFNGRLADRIAADESAPANPGPRWIAVAAAVVVVVLGGSWLLLRSPVAVDAPGAAPVFEAALEQATPEALDDLADWGGARVASGPYPDVSDLDEQAQRELLAWLRSQSS